MSRKLPSRSARSLPRIVFASIVALAFASSLAGCGQGSNTGPGKIHWDRETCEHCQMVISERRHAVQIRLPGDRQPHAFDDLGCGLLWLEGQELRTANVEGLEVWVKESATGDWIDARGAKFEEGLTTPMAYGFGVASSGLSLAEVQLAVRETERRRRAPVADPAGHAHHDDGMKAQDID